MATRDVVAAACGLMAVIILLRKKIGKAVSIIKTEKGGIKGTRRVSHLIEKRMWVHPISGYFRLLIRLIG